MPRLPVLLVLGVLLSVVGLACDSADALGPSSVDPGDSPSILDGWKLRAAPQVVSPVRKVETVGHALVATSPIGLAWWRPNAWAVHVSSDAGVTWVNYVVDAGAWAVAFDGTLASYPDVSSPEIAAAFPDGRLVEQSAPYTQLNVHSASGSSTAFGLGSPWARQLIVDEAGGIHVNAHSSTSRLYTYQYQPSVSGSPATITVLGQDRQEIFVVPTHPEIVFRRVLNNHDGSHTLSRSNDNGNTFVTQSMDGPVFSAEDGTLALVTGDRYYHSHNLGQTWHAVGSIPDGRAVVFAEGRLVIRDTPWAEFGQLLSSDSTGATAVVGPPTTVYEVAWVEGTRWLVHTWRGSVELDTRQGSHEWLTDSNALDAVLTPDGRVIDNQPEEGCLARSITRRGSRVLRACYLGDGVELSRDDGFTWERVGTGGEFVEFVTESIAYAVSTSAKLYRSGDGGESWAQAGDGGGHHFGRSLSGDGSGLLFAVTTVGRILRSEDFGDSWVPVDTGLPRGEDRVIEDVQSNDNFVASVTLDSERGRVYAGTKALGLFVSANRGETWVSVPGTAGIADSAVSPDGTMLIAERGGRLLELVPPSL